MANPILDTGIASPHSIYAAPVATQYHAVGQQASLGERRFRYARMTSGTAIGIGKIAQEAAPVANHIVQTGALGSVTAGSKRITVLLGATAAHANQYADGYLQIQSATTTGAGQFLKLGPHAAVASAGTATFDLYDPIVTTIAGTVTWSLVPAAGSDVIIHPASTAPPTAATAGVTLVDWAAASTTAPTFGWLQIWGPASVLKQTTAATLIAGAGVIIGDLAGTCTVEAAGTLTQRLGSAVDGLVTVTVFARVFLTIAP